MSPELMEKMSGYSTEKRFIIITSIVTGYDDQIVRTTMGDTILCNIDYMNYKIVVKKDGKLHDIYMDENSKPFKNSLTYKNLIIEE
jgi:hypothetical protein